MAQSRPLNLWTVEQVREIALRARRAPASVTANELRALAFYVHVRTMEMGEALG